MQKINFTWEIIIADDCSPDDTLNIVKQYQQKHSVIIKILPREKNVGPGLNFVELIRAATGKYIAYLEGDDYWTDPNKLQTQFDFMESNPDFSLCYHKIKWVYTTPRTDDPDLESNETCPNISEINDILKKGWFIRSCTLFFRNIKLPAGFEKLYVGDYPLHVLLADIGKICFINKCMGVYRINDNGSSELHLLDMKFEKRKSVLINEVYLNKYLNNITQYKYNSHFQSKIFYAVYSHLHYVTKSFPSKIISELFYVLTKFNWLFLVNESIYKIIQYFGKKGKSKK
jgi:glycosyltransferase involved in cell wall biosynthesis